MKCFVTGATGFVGGRLCEELRAKGHEVVAIARRGSDAARARECGCTVVEGSLESVNVFARHADTTDVFYHLAGITKALRRDDFLEVNARGTARILSGLERGGFAGKFVLLSSLAAGGPAANEKTPRRESDKDAPVSDYGRSKLAGERILRRRLPANAAFTILRPGAIYGPYEHEMLEVFRIIAKRGLAVQAGHAVRVQMTYVDDIVEGLLRVAPRGVTDGQIYYQTDFSTWSFPEIVRLTGESLGRDVRIVKLPVVAGGIVASVLDAAGKLRGRPLSPFGRDKFREMLGRWWIADSSRLEQDTGWKALTAFPEGLRQTIAWYRENQWL